MTDKAPFIVASTEAATTNWTSKTPHLRFNDGKLEQLVHHMSVTNNHMMSDPVPEWVVVESGSWPKETT